MKKWLKGLAILTVGAIFFAAAGCSIFEPAETDPPADTDPPVSTDPPTDTDPPISTDPPVGQTFKPHESAAGIPDRLTLESEKIDRFSQGGSSEFTWADGYSNGGMFNCTWRRSSAKIQNGVMSMSVSKEGKGYAGAEHRSKNKFSYGFYSVCMKAADCSGVISSFFTYTNQPVWDEIDIEFLGKDMTSVQFNYYTNGVGGHEFVFELGFDASEEFHEYAFDYRQNSITWYIDGKAVYRATENLPSHDMQIMMNVWNCIGIDEWSGALDTAALPATAQYQWFAYTPN